MKRLLQDHHDLLIPVALAGVLFALAISWFPGPAVEGDAFAYHMTAQRLISEGVFAYDSGSPESHVPANARVTPGYPLLLASVYAMVGIHGSPTEAVARVQPFVTALQFALALSIVLAVAVTGRLLGGRRLALVSGIAAALYVPFGWAATVALAETAGAALFAWLVCLSVYATARETVRRMALGLGLGVLAGATAMLRPVLIAWVLVPIVYLIARRPDGVRRTATFCAVVLVGVVLVFAPWWARNYELTGMRVLIRTDFIAPGGKLAFQTPPAQGHATDVPNWSQSLQPAVERQLVPAGTNVQQMLASIRQPWVPGLAVIYEDVSKAPVERVGLSNRFSASPLLAAELVMRWYQMLLIIAALASLAFIRRSPRLLVLWSVPVYVVAAHWNVQLNIRYAFLMMPAIVVLAAVGAYGVWRVAVKRQAA